MATNCLLPSQLLNQVLNRVTAERNLFDRVVTLWLPGEDLGAVHPTYQALVPLPGAVMPLVHSVPAQPGSAPPALAHPSVGRKVGREGGTSRWAWGAHPPPCLPVGLESVDHYPILVAVTGILVRLLVHGPASG